MQKKHIHLKNGFAFQFNSDRCRTCRGSCCRGLTGYIWLTREELQNIAELKNMPVTEFSRHFIRQVDGKLSLKERVVNGEYFCCFFDPIDCRCTIYENRPDQCRTFPFWSRFKDDPARLFQECPGVVSLEPDDG